jgi:hypothetical protein
MCWEGFVSLLPINMRIWQENGLLNLSEFIVAQKLAK